MELKDVGYTVKLITDVGVACPVCGHWEDAADIDVRINHLLGHEFQLLHIGSETSFDETGKPWVQTVAILGSSEAPTKREQEQWEPPSFQTSVKD